MMTRKILSTALVGTVLAFGIITNATNTTNAASAANAERRPAESKPAWQGHLDWATTNETGPDHLGCPDYYAEDAPECLNGGGRACLTRLAILAAKDHDDDAAFRLAMTTQCHDPAAVQSLAEAGHELVGEYLRTK